MVNGARDVETVRTFALVGHRSSGKTSLADGLLQRLGVTRAVGRVEAGTSLLDHTAESRRFRRSIGLSFAWAEHGANWLEFVDTPGSESCTQHRQLALACADGAVVVIDGSRSLGHGDRAVLHDVVRSRTPRIAVITKLDRVVGADDVVGLVDAWAEDHGVRSAALQVPLFQAGKLAGVVDLFTRELWVGAQRQPLPPEMAEDLDVIAAIDAGWERLAESVALTDDALLERYLEDLDLPPDVVRRGLVQASLRGRVIPVLFASSALDLGPDALLPWIIELLPSPMSRRPMTAFDTEGHEEDLVADPAQGFVAQHVTTELDESGEMYRVFRVVRGTVPRKGGWTHAESGAVAKVHKLHQLRGSRAATARYDGPGAFIATWDRVVSRAGDTWTDGARLVLGCPPWPSPMVSGLLNTESPRDATRLNEALEKLSALDAGLDLGWCALTGRPVLAANDEEHLDWALAILKERFGVSVSVSLPPVGYRETPVGRASGVVGRHQKPEEGEPDEFGEVVFDVAPLDESGNDLVDQRDREDVPDSFWPGIERGVGDGLRRGPLAGYPITGAELTCTGGSYDILCSTAEHFRAAAEKGVHAAMALAGTRLLEPWWAVQVRVPVPDVGAVLGELGQRRARVHGIETDEDEARILCDCPHRELRTLGPRLGQLTGGRGRFSGRYLAYEVLPAQYVREAIAASPFRPS
jgi:elongation factor G